MTQEFVYCILSHANLVPSFKDTELAPPDLLFQRTVVYR